MSPPYQIGRERLKNLLLAKGIDVEGIDKGLTSDNYVLPSREWFFGTFAQYWAECRAKFFPKGYRVGSSECHHYTHGAAFMAGRCYEFTFGQMDAVLCVGEFWFESELLQGEHSVLFSMFHDENQPQADPEMAWMEPQTSREYFLIQKEIQSCEFVRV